ncbi:GNAT family acetyltransferase [Aquimarina aggregata]|uniref:GNAT family acetyltransferase n=1 Tax=Aquimarina aggregata TaxID=1642818 RepID=A0A163CG87_9FLAO|nr:GNAT family N-acetyltransferase [Aquimarina aggregata]KZS42382.1 GNAT family acetyltransferase [Aquimarina aggregata]
MIIKSLNTIDFKILMNCFLKAFENYYMKMPEDHQYYRNRWKMANVCFDLSFGMFDNDKIVGFIINAIDKRDKDLIAFNTGTGIIPEYRRKGIVYKLYEHAIPKFKKNGVTKCSLEVIKDNTIAVKAYKRIGFRISKSYKCYNGELLLKDQLNDFELKQVDVSFFDRHTIPQKMYSWDNHIETLKRGDYEYYSLVMNENEIAYFVINSTNGYLAQFDVFIDQKDNWIRLFSAIKRMTNSIKINNVDEALDSKLSFIKSMGILNTIDQFEMDLRI